MLTNNTPGNFNSFPTIETNFVIRMIVRTIRVCTMCHYFPPNEKNSMFFMIALDSRSARSTQMFLAINSPIGQLVLTVNAPGNSSLYFTGLPYFRIRVVMRTIRVCTMSHLFFTSFLW
jgi:hypothetical protein